MKWKRRVRSSPPLTSPRTGTRASFRSRAAWSSACTPTWRGARWKSPTRSRSESRLKQRKRPRPLILEPIAGFEEPPDDRHADGEECKRRQQAQSYIHVGDAEKAPAEPADQIKQRIEQGHRAPERRQHAGRIERAAEERQRRQEEKRHNLQLFEAARP